MERRQVQDMGGTIDWRVFVPRTLKTLRPTLYSSLGGGNNKRHWICRVSLSLSLSLSLYTFDSIEMEHTSIHPYIHTYTSNEITK